MFLLLVCALFFFFFFFFCISMSFHSLFPCASNISFFNLFLSIFLYFHVISFANIFFSIFLYFCYFIVQPASVHFIYFICSLGLSNSFCLIFHIIFCGIWLVCVLLPYFCNNQKNSSGTLEF